MVTISIQSFDNVGEVAVRGLFDIFAYCQQLSLSNINKNVREKYLNSFAKVGQIREFSSHEPEASKIHNQLRYGTFGIEGAIIYQIFMHKFGLFFIKMEFTC